MSVYPNFEVDEHSCWVAELPKEAPKFFGHRLEISVCDHRMGFQARMARLGEILKAPRTGKVEKLDLTEGVEAPLPEDLALIESILEHLPEIIGQAEREYEIYEKESAPDFREEIFHPHIWLGDDRESPENWALVVEREWSDLGTHIEFAGARFTQIWSAG